MANFLKPKGASTKGWDSESSMQTLLAGEDTIVALWGGGPGPDYKDLEVLAVPADWVELVELPRIDKHTRKFRIVAKKLGLATIFATVGKGGPPYAVMFVLITAGPPAAPVKTIAPDLEFDGQTLTWKSKGKTYKASSGLIPEKPGDTDWRESKYMCVVDHGPIPEGKYSLGTFIDPQKYSKDNGSGTCDLRASGYIQQIPRGAMAGECEQYWINWGNNRVALEPEDAAARHGCNPGRGGFYIHDSVKGYTHGCIEVQTAFFNDLYSYASTSKRKRLTLKVKYTHQSTYGGTKVP